jgi:hypothetical protein
VRRIRTGLVEEDCLGLNPARIPAEESGGSGAISKQGNTMARRLLIETVQHAARQDPEPRQDYRRVCPLLLFHSSPPRVPTITLN